MALPYLEFNHVCIVVRSIEDAAKNWMQFMGVTEEDCFPFEIDVPEEDTWVKVFQIPAVNGVWIQLIQPMTEKGGMAAHLEKHGEGVQHIGFACPESKMDEVKQLVNQKTSFKWIFPEPIGPKGRRYQITHPKYSNGIIIETLSKGWDSDWRAIKAKGERL